MVGAHQIYQHSKTGNKYEILAVGKDATTLQEMVVYKCLYRNPTSLVWIRSLTEFESTVVLDNKEVKRFVRID